MKLSLFSAALAVVVPAVSADVYFKEQFNDDVSYGLSGAGSCQRQKNMVLAKKIDIRRGMAMPTTTRRLRLQFKARLCPSKESG